MESRQITLIAVSDDEVAQTRRLTATVPYLTTEEAVVVARSRTLPDGRRRTWLVYEGSSRRLIATCQRPGHAWETEAGELRVIDPDFEAHVRLGGVEHAQALTSGLVLVGDMLCDGRVRPLDPCVHLDATLTEDEAPTFTQDADGGIIGKRVYQMGDWAVLQTILDTAGHAQATIQVQVLRPDLLPTTPGLDASRLADDMTQAAREDAVLRAAEELVAQPDRRRLAELVQVVRDQG